MVDHEVDDPGLDYAAPVPRASRAEPLAGRERSIAGQTGGPGVSAAEDLTTDLNARIDIIEEAYEYFLAYASQGLPSDPGSDTGRQARQKLQRCNAALRRLIVVLSRYVM